MTQGLDVPHIGLGGGLALLWHENIDLAIKTYSPHHMNTLISFEGVEWCFTSIYGHPVIARRGESWELLCHLHARMSYPWLLMGDFNEILHPDEY